MKKAKCKVVSMRRVTAQVLAVALTGAPITIAMAGGNSSGQPSGTTVAGSTTTPPPAMSGMTSVIVNGGARSSTSTSTTSTGGTSTTRTVSVPASSVSLSLSTVGLNIPASGSPSQTYVGTTGTFTVSNRGGVVTIQQVSASAPSGDTGAGSLGSFPGGLNASTPQQSAPSTGSSGTDGTGSSSPTETAGGVVAGDAVPFFGISAPSGAPSGGASTGDAAPRTGGAGSGAPAIQANPDGSLSTSAAVNHL